MSARNGHRSRFHIARKARMHSRENIRSLRKGFAAKESQPESAASCYRTPNNWGSSHQNGSVC